MCGPRVGEEKSILYLSQLHMHDTGVNGVLLMPMISKIMPANLMRMEPMDRDSNVVHVHTQGVLGSHPGAKAPGAVKENPGKKRNASPI